MAYKLSESFELEMVSLGKDEKSNQQISVHWQLSTFSLVLCILTCAMVHVAQNEAKAQGKGHWWVVFSIVPSRHSFAWDGRGEILGQL